jgi:hypothetical protein
VNLEWPMALGGQVTEEVTEAGENGAPGPLP